MNKYRIAFQGKKWYRCIFTWMVDAAVQNASILHKKSGGKMLYSTFKELAHTFLARYEIPPKKRRSLSMPKTAKSESWLNYATMALNITRLGPQQRNAGDARETIVSYDNCAKRLLVNAVNAMLVCA